MSTTPPSRKKTKKRSTVRHTRAIQRDRTKRPLSLPIDEQVSQHLTQIIHPATLAQVAHAREKRQSAAVLSPRKVVTAIEMTF